MAKGNPGTSASARELGTSFLIVTAAAVLAALSLGMPLAALAGVCGNGILETGEVCDDGNTNESDTCLSDCTLNPACGTLTGTWHEGAMGSVVELLEEPGGVLHGAGGMDIFGSNGLMRMVGDGSRSGTSVTWLGHTGSWQSCDWLYFPGYFSPSRGLELLRTSRSACGDGVLDPGESCDDANAANADGCNFYVFAPPVPSCGIGMLASFCVATPVGCGNGEIDPGEQCDDGNASACDACTSMCTLPCGDGIVGPGEQCDDAGPSPTCNANCTLHGCGDSIVDAQAGEQCDDGNTISCDGCSSSCTLEVGQVCGDGIANAACGEQCDGNDLAACNGVCAADCTCVPFCGNGVIDPGEACDGVSATCDPDCTLAACGDGVVNALAGEACDDGNTISCDGCSSTCAIEAGQACGDGVVNAECGEQCDDGNTASCDGCSPTCQIVARPVCGDGVADSACGEQCDDGNMLFCDGCSPFCQIDTEVSVCGDGIVSPRCGEQCDDGNTMDGDCCSSRCAFEAPGASCSDGLACNGAEFCNGAGSCRPGTPPDCNDTDPCTRDDCADPGGCRHVPAPLAACNEAPLQSVLVRMRAGESATARLRWTQDGGDGCDVTALGDPRVATWYALCVYDSSGSGWSEQMSTFVLPDANLWKHRGDRGVTYRDPRGSGGGVRRLRIDPGILGPPGIDLRIDGRFSVAPLPVTTDRYFDQSPSVVLQLWNSEGACWGGQFDSAIENSGQRFEAGIE